MKNVIILFDGSCLLCNAWVRRLCRWDSKDVLRFATLESNTAKIFFEEHNLNPNSMETAVFAISITYLLPIVAIGWGIFDGESFSKFQWLAAFLIISGVYLGQKKTSK